MTAIGPNMKKLVTARVSVLAIPPGVPNAFAAGLRTLAEPGQLAKLWKQAYAEMVTAVRAVRSAPDNTFGDDEESIAAELLRRMREARA